jgi:hypothetical protein
MGRRHLGGDKYRSLLEEMNCLHANLNVPGCMKKSSTVGMFGCANPSHRRISFAVCPKLVGFMGHDLTATARPVPRWTATLTALNRAELTPEMVERYPTYSLVHQMQSGHQRCSCVHELELPVNSPGFGRYTLHTGKCH